MVRAPENDFTRMIERVAHGNATGEFGGGGVASAGPRPTVASAALGREVPDLPPLTAEERRDLDRKAVELGLLPPTESQGLYETQEDALRAAGVDIDAPPAPTDDPVEALLRQPRMSTREAMYLARENGTFQPQVQIVETARFPDFTKPQGMDLQKGVVYLDSMEFAIPEQHLRKLRKFVVELAHRAVMQKLEEAMGLFGPEVPSGQTGESSKGTTVQLFPERSS